MENKTEAIKIIVEHGGSVSILQRRLRISHREANEILDTLEEEGIVGPHNGTKMRVVYLNKIEDYYKTIRCGDCEKRIVMHAFSDSNCISCDKHINSPYTPSDKICKKCSLRYGLCQQCGIPLDFNDNQKIYYSLEACFIDDFKTIFIHESLDRVNKIKEFYINFQKQTFKRYEKTYGTTYYNDVSKCDHLINILALENKENKKVSIEYDLLWERLIDFRIKNRITEVIEFNINENTTIKPSSNLF